MMRSLNWPAEEGGYDGSCHPNGSNRPDRDVQGESYVRPMRRAPLLARRRVTNQACGAKCVGRTQNAQEARGAETRLLIDPYGYEGPWFREIERPLALGRGARLQLARPRRALPGPRC